jgi:hypothetical protein
MANPVTGILDGPSVVRALPYQAYLTEWRRRSNLWPPADAIVREFSTKSRGSARSAPNRPAPFVSTYASVVEA